MTPKQKAIIIHDKMFVNSKSIGGAFTDWELAKQCAIIAVDEILRAVDGKYEEYWQQVKQELELL